MQINNITEEDFSADIMSALQNAESDSSLLKSIDYTRPLNEYPTIDKITQHLRRNDKTYHIYTESLNVNGVLVADSMEKYLNDDGIGSSTLKAALKTPLDFHFARSEDKEELEKIKGTPAYFNIGTFLHQCILEPSKFSMAIVEPGYGMNTTEGVNNAIDFWEKTIRERGFGVIDGEDVKCENVLENCSLLVTEQLGLSLDKIDGKRAYVAALKKCSGMEPVTEENFLKISILKKHIDNYGNGIIYRLLKHSKREISCYYQDEETGLRLKVRPDALQFAENIGENAVISVKSTACENLTAFFNHAAKLDYDLSEGMYQEVLSKSTGRDFNTTIMIMLQTVPPYHVAVMVWKAEDIEMGKYKYRTALHNASEIIKEGSVKGYDSYAENENMGIIEMQLPGWNQKTLLPQNI